jgi:hypothetical protein
MGKKRKKSLTAKSDENKIVVSFEVSKIFPTCMGICSWKREKDHNASNIVEDSFL